MKTFKTTFLLFAFLSIVISCEKPEEFKPEPEDGYPLIYKHLSDSEWQAQNVTFQKIMPDEGLELNEYGFLSGSVVMDSAIEFNAQNVIQEINEIIHKYAEFMGIKEVANVDIENELLAYTHLGISISVSDYFLTEIDENSNIHSFYLIQKSVNEVGIEYTQLCFSFNINDKIIAVSGNWFPEVFIPNDKIYTINEAIRIAVNYGQDNSDKQFSTTEDNIGTIVKLLPVLAGENVEIHECWRITFWDKTCIFFVDTQTGEVLKFVNYSSYI